jgi:hypothetical protein
VFGGVLLFHPVRAVSLALAGLASGFGMGPGVSLPLLTAVTLFILFQCPQLLLGGGVLVVGCSHGDCWMWLRALCVSFRPVSASSLNTLLCVQVWSIDPVVCGGPYPS